MYKLFPIDFRPINNNSPAPRKRKMVVDGLLTQDHEKDEALAGLTGFQCTQDYKQKES